MPGELHWSVGFFGKPQFRSALRTSGKDVNLPPQLKDNPALQDDQGTLETPYEDMVMHTPPDPLFPSGIVSVIVHQVVNLEMKDLKGTFGKRKDGKEYSPGMSTGENKQEEGGKLPSSYCTILLNDELVYRTRAKVMSSKPIFNAGTERFIRDWRSGIITVSVRDQRQREHDALLGVVSLKLSDLLQTSSEVTRWFPLDGGIGFGQIRISVLFRSLDLSLPPNLLGWNVGTFEFPGDKITSTLDKPAKIKFRTGGSVGKISRKNCTVSGTGVEWSTVIDARKNQKLRLPVKFRYMSPICIDIFRSSNARKPDAHAMIWLDKLVDNQSTTCTIPIWTTDNSRRLTQNYIENIGDHPKLKIEEIGTITFESRFQPGMDNDHERFSSGNDSRETFETWQACSGEGIRGDTVHAETSYIVEELHQNSVNEMRNDLAKTERGELEEGEADQLSDKYGKDWKELFEKYQVDTGTDRSRRGSSQVQQQYNEFDDEDDYDDSDSSSEQSSDESHDSFHHVSGPRYHENTPEPIATNPDPTRGGEVARMPEEKKSGFRKYRENQKSMHRRHQGLMQWKPMRSLAFAKDEAKFGVRKLKNKVKLSGREPDVETEV